MREPDAARVPLDPPADSTPASARIGTDRQPGSAFETVVARNRAFAAAGGHEGATLFPALGLFVIGCLDPRVDPAQILGLSLGEALVIRNGGGRVTPEVINHVALVGQLAENAVPEGPLFEVAVIHHTECGAGALADDEFRHRLARRTGADDATLRASAVVDPAATIAIDVDRLRAAEAISPRITVSGHVYDVTSGLVETIVAASAATPQSRAA